MAYTLDSRERFKISRERNMSCLNECGLKCLNSASTTDKKHDEDQLRIDRYNLGQQN